MKRYRIMSVAFLLFCCIESCLRPRSGEPPHFRRPGSYNLKFTCADRNIGDPEHDRRAYYKIFINKIESGRTTIGLESQRKIFTASLPANRHLIRIEKWILDTKKERYVKLNNIEQPKPNYVYVDIPTDRVVLINLSCDANTNSATFSVEYE